MTSKILVTKEKNKSYANLIHYKRSASITHKTPQALPSLKIIKKKKIHIGQKNKKV